MLTTEALSRGLGYFELVFGLVFLIWTLRGNAFRGESEANRRATRNLAPLGLIFLVNGALRLLRGTVPMPLLIGASLAVFFVVIVWAVRLHRSNKAQRSLPPPTAR